MFEGFLEELKKAQAKQDVFKKNPDSPEAKAHAKRAGLSMLGLGVLLLFAAVAEWLYLDMVHYLLPIAGVVFMAFGLHSVVTGKMKR